MSEIIGKILNELERAETIHPDWPCDVIHQAAIVCEESGEMLREALHVEYEGACKTELKNELIQTAAMCLRMLMNLKD